MSDCTRWSFKQQIDWFRRQFAQHDSLPLSDVLSASTVQDALQSLGVRFYDSLYNPVTLLWLFLNQVIHANPTLAATVENFLAWRLGQGMSPCSTDTGAYARARQQLPKRLLAMLARGCQEPFFSVENAINRAAIGCSLRLFHPPKLPTRLPLVKNIS